MPDPRGKSWPVRSYSVIRDLRESSASYQSPIWYARRRIFPINFRSHAQEIDRHLDLAGSDDDAAVDEEQSNEAED